MKTLFKYFCLAALALILTGCLRDDRNNFMVSDSLGLTAREKLISASVHTGSISFGVAKNGKGSSPASATLSSRQEDVESAVKLYNLQKETAYKTLGEEYFSLDTPSLHWNVDEVTKVVTLTWDPEVLADFIGDDKNWVIPLRLLSGDLDVNAENNFMMVNVVRSTVSLAQGNAPLTRSANKADFEPKEDGTPAVTEETVTLDIKSTGVIPGIAIDFPVKIDPSLIPGFIADKEETFQETIPDGLLTLIDNHVTLEAGKTDGQFKVKLDKAKLLNDDGQLEEFDPVVVPVRVDATGMTAKRDGADFTLKGLHFGNLVCYFVFRYASDGIADVSRIWGLYSVDNTLGNTLDGIAQQGNRTLAMDDEYVYVTNSAGAGGIYALSLSAGTLVRKLDLGTAAGMGCTFPSSCVRMIPSSTGKDILSFCTLKEDGNQKLYVYAYVNGTDQAPVQILEYLLDKKPAPGVDDFRRYGDRYTVKGTWENGQLWFHCQNADGEKRGKTVVFTLQNGEITNPDDPLSYLLDGTSDVATIRDVAFYPGWDKVLVTRKDAARVFGITTDASDNGWIKWEEDQDVDLSDDLALAMGFNTFTFHNKPFICYAQMDAEGGKSARLVIIEDGCTKPADFPDVLLAQKGYMEFALQGESLEVKSPVSSDHSVCDCTVRTIGSNTYIAALMQAGGVCLFQLQ